MPTGNHQDWHCAAYSADGPNDCFVGLDAPCTSRQQCETRMAGVRQRVYRGIQERAAHGDPDMVRLAEDYTAPDDILTGPDDATPR